jgi:hypothetical protein
VRLLADPGEHHPGWIATGRQDTLEFTDRDDVEALAEAGEDVEHG